MVMYPHTFKLKKIQEPRKVLTTNIPNLYPVTYGFPLKHKRKLIITLKRMVLSL